MPIVQNDLLMKFSTTSGSAGYSLASSAASSLGKYVSTTTWDGTLINDLFQDLTVEDNTSGVVDYRCLFLLNNHATLTLGNAVLWIYSSVSGGADIAIGLDSTGSTPKTNISSQAVTIANVNAVPSGVTFSTPTSKATGLNIGNLIDGNVYGIWIRRTANNTVFLANDGAVLQVEGDTSP